MGARECGDQSGDAVRILEWHEGVIDAMIPMRPDRDAQLAEVERLSLSEARLRAYVTFCCGVLAGTISIHHVIRGAADSEPSVDRRSGRSRSTLN